jgi:hypothetical protein
MGISVPKLEIKYLLRNACLSLFNAHTHSAAIRARIRARRSVIVGILFPRVFPFVSLKSLANL